MPEFGHVAGLRTRPGISARVAADHDGNAQQPLLVARRRRPWMAAWVCLAAVAVYHLAGYSGAAPAIASFVLEPFLSFITFLTVSEAVGPSTTMTPLALMSAE